MSKLKLYFKIVCLTLFLITVPYYFLFYKLKNVHQQTKISRNETMMPSDSYLVMFGNNFLVANVTKETGKMALDTNHPEKNIKPMNVCSNPPPGLVGRQHISLTLTNDSKLTDLDPGGAWRPHDCVARHRVAIIIPFRDRAHHLKVLLYYLIPFLKRQLVDFRIFVVEQHGNETFNKGRIMNAGYKEALKEMDFECVIFHDVDLIPEDDRNLYYCFANPWHMSVAIDIYKYRLPYTALIGGVLNMRKDFYEKVNGFTNLLWGWGSEDDEMEIRIKTVGLRLKRPSTEYARYTCITHATREQGPGFWRRNLTRTVPRRIKKDGLSSVDYKLLDKVYYSAFTHIVIDIGKKPAVMPDIKMFFS